MKRQIEVQQAAGYPIGRYVYVVYTIYGSTIDYIDYIYVTAGLETPIQSIGSQCFACTRIYSHS